MNQDANNLPMVGAFQEPPGYVESQRASMAT